MTVHRIHRTNTGMVSDHIIPFRRIYGIALTTVATLAILGQVLVTRTLAEEYKAAEAVHLGAMLRIGTLNLYKDFYSLKLFTGPELEARLNLVRQDETRRRADFIALRALHNPHSAPFLASGTSLDQSNETLSNAVRTSIDPGGGLLEPQYDQAVLSLAKQEASTENSFDNLVKGLAFESEHRASYIPTIQVGVMLLTILVLLVEARLLLFPRVKKLGTRVDALEVEGAAAEERSRQFEAENEKLRAGHHALQGVATKLEAANQRIEVAAKRFEELFQGLPIACLGFDTSGAIQEWNRASEEMFGDAPKLFHVDLFELLAPVRDEENVREIIQKVFRNEACPSVLIESKLGDEVRYLLCSSFPVHAPDGVVNCAIFACVDVTAQKKYERQIEEHLTRINEYSVEIEQQKWELQEANERLHALARHDGLTDLLNHRSFQEELARNVRRVERDGGALSIVLIDVDHFKSYNDTFGHPAGDAVLKKFANLILSCSRESDLVARYGGEEFVAILAGTDAEGARFVAERMRFTIETADWPQRATTASFGVATLTEELDSPAALIEAADKALYAAKEAGRNVVRHTNDMIKAA